jgi:hypothetical protein
MATITPAPTQADATPLFTHMTRPRVVPAYR